MQNYSTIRVWAAPMYGDPLVGLAAYKCRDSRQLSSYVDSVGLLRR